MTSGPDLGPALTHRAAHVPKLSPLRLRLTCPVRCSGPRGPGTLSLHPPTLDLLSGSGGGGGHVMPRRVGGAELGYSPQRFMPYFCQLRPPFTSSMASQISFSSQGANISYTSLWGTCKPQACRGHLCYSLSPQRPQPKASTVHVFIFIVWNSLSHGHFSQSLGASPRLNVAL